MQPGEVPTKPRRKWVIEQANALSRIYRAAPVPVKEIAEQNGVQILLADFGEHRDEASGVCDFSKKKILVNFADLPARRRFTIAHERGRTTPARWNRRANRFAAHLLVPDRLLRPVAKVATASQLADIFGVSRTMMEIRMNSVLG